MEIFETESRSASGVIPLLSPNSDMEWWEYDLQLAAELGKALLQRNQDLETQLQDAETLSREHQAETQFLSQKLATLRSLNETRMKMYEQVDTNAQDLEEANRKLLSQSHGAKEIMAALTNSLESAETRVESLEKQLNALRNENKEKEENSDKELAKQIQFQQDLNCKALQEEVDKLRRELESSSEIRDANQRENDAAICSLMEENKALNMTVDVLRGKMAQLLDNDDEDDDAGQKRRDKNVSFEDRSPEPRSEIEGEEDEEESSTPLKCRLCGVCMEDACKRCLTARIQEEIECDDLDSSLTIKDPVVVRLKHGGSAYGSRDSLNKIAIISPENEFGNSVIGVFNVERSPNAGDGGDKRGIDDFVGRLDLGPESLMSEMGAQYAVLIQKYESIIKQKEEVEKADEESKKKNAEDESKDATDVVVVATATSSVNAATSITTSTDFLSTPVKREAFNSPWTGDVSAMPKRGIGNVVEKAGDSATSRSVQTESIFLGAALEEDGTGGRSSSHSPSPNNASEKARKRQCRSLIVTGLEQGRDPTDFGFDHSPPEYKQLFKEIFATLRKTVDKESARPPTPPRESNKSPTPPVED